MGTTPVQGAGWSTASAAWCVNRGGDDTAWPAQPEASGFDIDRDKINRITDHPTRPAPPHVGANEMSCR